MEEISNPLVENPEGKRLLGRTNHRWENNIKTDIKEILCECVDWIYLAQNRD
jgi:hypothetical protein